MPVEYIPHPIRAIVNNVTGARAYGVIYQNVTLRPMLIIIANHHLVLNVALQCNVSVDIGGVSPPVFTAAYGGYFNPPAMVPPLTFAYSTITFIVPAGWFYRALDNSPAPNVNVIASWWEINL